VNQQTPSRHLVAIALVVVAGLVSVIAGLVVGGGADPLQFSDPGPVVRFGAPFAKLVMNFSMATAVGSLVLSAYAADSKERLKLAPVAAWSAAIWALAASVNFVMTYLSVSGSEISYGQTFSDSLWLFATDIELGVLLVWNLGIAFVLSLTTLAFVGRRMTAINAAIAIAGLYPLAASGHASSDAGHALAVNSLLMHLVGISIWVGGLIALYVVFRGQSERSAVLVSRYSSLALVAFIMVAISGVTSGVIRLYEPADLFSSYGLLLIGKASLLVALGLIAARHRLSLVRQFSQRAVGFWRLALVEIAIMGLAIGLGTALAKTQTPLDQAEFVPLTPTEILTGDKLPPELTDASWLTVWDIDVLWISVCLGAIVFYLYGVWVLRRRGDRWPIARTLSWIGGMLTLLYVTNGALNAYQEYLFSMHMIGHMVLSMMVPVLLVPGAPVTLLVRAQPARKDDSWGLREWVLWAVHTPFAWFISHPLFAGLNFALSLVMFYYTPLFRWATEDHLGHQWMLIHFLITGYLFVQSLMGVDPQPHKTGYPVKLMLLIGTMAFHAFFGLGLMNEKSLLLANWFGAMGRTWGDDPLTDQAVGGAFAWGVGEIPTIVIALIVVTQWSRSDDRERKRLDRASDRTGNKDLEDYNQMLQQLSDTKDQRR